MPRYSTAYSDWLRRRAEIQTIISMTRRVPNVPARRRGTPPLHVLCRSGVVLLCSHLEGYIEDLVRVAIARIVERGVKKSGLAPRLKYHLSHDLIDAIGQAGDAPRKSAATTKFIRRDWHIWDDSETFTQPLPAESILRPFMTPNHDNIKGLFRKFGYNRFDGDLAHVLKSGHPGCVNAINNLVSERNKIAHGDHLAVGTPNDLIFLYEQTNIYCMTTDVVVGDWFRSIGCSIR